MGFDKVTSFMDRLNEDNTRDNEYRDAASTVDAKLRVLHNNKEDGCNKCVNKVLSDLYVKTVPLSDDYKMAYKDKMDEEFPNFIKTRIDDRGMDYYIHEAIKKGNPFAKRLATAVEKVVDEDLKDKEYDIDNLNPEDLVFKMSDDNLKKLDVVASDLSTDELSDKIRQNVISSVSHEIKKSKEQKERDARLEEELKNDPKMISNEALEHVAAYEDLHKDRFYTPSLFESIMIHNTDKIANAVMEGTFTPEYTYSANSLFTSLMEENEKISDEDEKSVKESLEEDPNVLEYAFIESVKEYTCWNILKGLRLENLYPRDIEAIATSYNN